MKDFGDMSTTSMEKYFECCLRQLVFQLKDKTWHIPVRNTGDGHHENRSGFQTKSFSRMNQGNKEYNSMVVQTNMF